MEGIVCNPKRTLVLRLDIGDDLILSLKEAVKKYNIRCGFFVMIGGLKEITYGLYKEGKHGEIKKTAKNCFEILSATGNITIKEGDILIHSHILAADEGYGTAFGGHLMEGSKVFPFAEIIIQELDASIDRNFDPKINLWPMKF